MRDLRSTAVAAVAAVACLSSCAGGRGGSPAVAGAIKGNELSAFSCGGTPGGPVVSVKPATVVELKVCAQSVPSPFGQPRHAISLTRSSAGFAGLLKALSLPDIRRSPGVMCPLYAELRPPILARARSQALLVHVPVDGCDHTLPAVSAALAAVIGQASDSPAVSGPT